MTEREELARIAALSVELFYLRLRRTCARNAAAMYCALDFAEQNAIPALRESVQVKAVHAIAKAMARD
jgi:hypothetical protein